MIRIIECFRRWIPAILLLVVFQVASCGKDKGTTPPATGACCATAGTCTVTTQTACVSPSTWQGAGTSCTPNPCTQPTGACCATAGTCTVTTQAACVSPSTWQGAGTSCTPDPCPAPPGMVRISPGTFTMGSPVDEPGRYDSEIQHQVTLTKAIYVSTNEVTQTEWQAVMGWNESSSPGTGKPVEQVTWYDAVSYCNQRSTLDGYTPAYAITGVTQSGNHITGATVAWNQSADGYRLLTEAEWEYACRATSTSAFCNGGIMNTSCSPLDPNLDQVGWYCGNAWTTTHDCGGKAANAWGLKDMHGNVQEWCWDWYADYPSGSVSDPLGPPSGPGRAVRGGSRNDWAQDCRSACRVFYTPDVSLMSIGLRPARTSP